MRLNPRLQDDLGERSAMLWFGAQGAAVFVPLFQCRDYDLIADWGQGAMRVQVKTSNVSRRNRWEVAVCTRGGNQSWNGLVKRLDPSRYDYLFVHVGDGLRWFIPSSVVEGGTKIALGGPKYGEFEIEPGDPLPAHLASLETPAPRWTRPPLGGVA